MVALAALKALAATAIFATALIGGLFPIKLKHWSKNQSTLSYANCLGAGVLLGAALLHMLFDAEEQWKPDSPMLHFMCTIGFLASFVLEKLLFAHSHGVEDEGLQMAEISHAFSTGNVILVTTG